MLPFIIFLYVIIKILIMFLFYNFIILNKLEIKLDYL